jgi:ubiquinone/menaquinone biosynthesis C-methylase UbiE
MFRERTYELENIDKGSYTAEEYEGCISELQFVNRWMGDSWALRRSLLKEIGESGLKSFTLLDVGAGSGELLRVAAEGARAKGIKAFLVGIELNSQSTKAIIEDSKHYENIRAVRGDALNLPFADNSFDYALCSLFTHHFKEPQIIAILQEMHRVARRAVYVIDLHRHPIAYAFYTTIGKLFLHNRLIREDGALSILRSFKPSELKKLAVEAGLSRISIRRRFPYRLVLSGH